MTKRKLNLLIFGIGVAVAIFIYIEGIKKTSEFIGDGENNVSQRKIIQGKDKKPLEQMPAGTNVANVVSKDWKENLVKSFNALSKKIKKIDIEQEQSLTWIQDGNALLVESVKIILIDDKNEESSFRALIDPQTGKVLETWDRSISDSASPREEFKLKLDSRYQ